MSMKPLKHSEMKKRRDKQILVAPEYHLIVTEGTKTEPNYFKGFKQEINAKYPDKVNVDVEGIGDNTLSLLERAIKLVERNINTINHVWLVYDKDDFPDDDFDNTVNRCAALSKSEVKYHALWSNECIEFWFLLHFEYLQAALLRDDYYPKLTEHLKKLTENPEYKYKKNNGDIYATLRNRMPIAIREAKKLLNWHGDLPPSSCTPGTKVYEIFEFFAKDKYLKL